MNTSISSRGAMCVLVASAVFALSACESKNDTSPGTATTPTPTPAPTPSREPSLVRIIHAIPGGAAADVYAGDNKLFSGVGYKTVTSYEQVMDRSVTFKLKLPTQAESVAENKEKLSQAGHYTLIAVPGERGEGGELKVLTDDKEATKEGQARLRVVNAVPDVKELEVGFKTAKEPLVSGLNASDDVGYRDVMAATGILEVRDKAKKRIVASLNGVTIVAGKVYTLVIVGRTTGTPKAELLLIEDGLQAPVSMPAATPASSPLN